jgi:transposase
MLTKEDDVEIHALARRGWSVSAIARHTGRDRKTVRKYLKGPRPAGEPAPSGLEPYRAYLQARFAEDAHIDGTVLYREVVKLGFERSYVTFVRQLRLLGLRPRCEACRTGGQGVTTVIPHEPGEEIQWDWLELHETPWGEPAFLIVGALSFSSKARAVICEGQSSAHLVEGIDGVLRRLGGSSRAWRTDRMATVVHPGTNRVTAGFAQVAKHYGVEVWVCPPRRPQRKGVVEAAIKYITRSWRRTAPVSSLGQAQADLDRWAISVADRRKRQDGTIAELAARENLLALPGAAFPALLESERVVSRTALVAFEGNRYSVPPGFVGQAVTVRARLGELHLEIISPAGRRIARHRRAPAGAGQILRTQEHARLLERSGRAGHNRPRPGRQRRRLRGRGRVDDRRAHCTGHDQLALRQRRVGAAARDRVRHPLGLDPWPSHTASPSSTSSSSPSLLMMPPRGRTAACSRCVRARRRW